jgi:ubiquinone/menaquinone biosynthesis C-methylase UbiE
MEASEKPAGAVMGGSGAAALAFNAVAPVFDERFGAWASVAAQRRAVRTVLLRTLPPGGRVLELGGGTGEDAAFLASHGYDILLTDPSPAMVSLAQAKLGPLGARAEVAAAEEMDGFASRYVSTGGPLFDGVFSNFAPLNCVVNLRPVARGLARLLKPGAPALLVLFGTLCPGEIATELLCKRPGQALRRCKRGAVAARLAGHEFRIVYHRRAALRRALQPWFVLERRIGIGIAVPPSAAEPWISNHPRLLSAMESLDRLLSYRLAGFGDHVLYQFRRTAAPSTME